MENEITESEMDLNLSKEVGPKIYSKKAIWAFSIFFSAIFGGVLLMQNLKDIDKRKEAYMVLLFSIVFTVSVIYIVNIPERPQTSLTYLCNMVGGLILSEYFFKKHFTNDKSYPKKKIWKPLIISILITIPFILALIYGQ